MPTTKTVFFLLFCYASSIPLIHHLFQSQIQFWKPQNESHFKKWPKIIQISSVDSHIHHFPITFVCMNHFLRRTRVTSVSQYHTRENEYLLWRLWMWNKWMRFKNPYCQFFSLLLWILVIVVCFKIFVAFYIEVKRDEWVEFGGREGTEK